jgi:hypothetical protein
MPLIAQMASPLFEIALMLVRLDQVAPFIEYANHSVMSAAVKLGCRLHC